MRTSLILFVIASALLVACNKTPFSPSAAAAGDPITLKLQELAGPGPTDCGRVKSQALEPTQKARECAMAAAKDKRAFYVAYDLPGLTVGVAGNSQGKLFSLQVEQPENAPAGTKPEIRSAPCPSDLRVAQSGRVTCMTPSAGTGTMGGASPHGGMGIPPSGTPNPHGITQPSHPPTSKPKQ